MGNVFNAKRQHYYYSFCLAGTLFSYLSPLHIYSNIYFINNWRIYKVAELEKLGGQFIHQFFIFAISLCFVILLRIAFANTMIQLDIESLQTRVPLQNQGLTLPLAAIMPRRAEILCTVILH